MFFVKAAFWVFLIFLLIPTSGNEKSDFYNVTGRTIADLSNFCDRNPDVCEKAGAMLETLLRKVRNTTVMVEDMLREAGSEATPMRAAPNQPGDARMAPTGSNGQNTLRPDDMHPTWRGPAPADRRAL